MSTCTHCNGHGRVSSISTQSVQIIRAIEQDLIENGRNNISLQTDASLVDYILNKKRKDIFEIEQKYNISITVDSDKLDDEQIYNITHHSIEAIPTTQSTPVSIDSVYDENKPTEDTQDEEKTVSKKTKQYANARKIRNKRKGIPKSDSKNNKNAEVNAINEEKLIVENDNKNIKKEAEEKPKVIKNKKPVKKNDKVNKTNNSDKEEEKVTKPRKKTNQRENKLKEENSIKKEPIENPKTGWWDE